jgi:hypothetical protein
MSDRELLE